MIHSDWRMANNLVKLKALFRLYNLEDYVIGVCPQCDKGEAIFEYIEKKQDWIHRYAVLDDAEMTTEFGHYFVKTRDIINMDNYKQCVNVLSCTYSLNIEELLV